jgi:hypothetical protein
MLDKLDLKIKQMHKALGGLKQSDLSTVKPEVISSEQVLYVSVDFKQGHTEEGLANIASLLIANIASIKDHLKVWCDKNNVSFKGENLINRDRNVAHVHDLWNIDKHATLNRKPRSGHLPHIQGLNQMLSVSTGAAAGSSSLFTMDMNGKMKAQTTGSGSVNLAITGQVVNANGDLLGDFGDICEKATTAWEQELKQAGVPIPVR